jgi:hypothetical protein
MLPFHAMRDELTIKPEGLRRDVWWFFSLPIPRAVWEKFKVLQNDKFAFYVEDCCTGSRLSANARDGQMPGYLEADIRCGQPSGSGVEHPCDGEFALENRKAGQTGPAFSHHAA